MRRYLTARCLRLHLTLAVLLPTFAALTDWQARRALAGNTLSWAYTFEWPLFGVYAIYMWWKLINDDGVHEAARPEEAGYDLAGDAPGEVGTGGGATPVTAGPVEDRPGWALGPTREERRRRKLAARASAHGAEGR